MKFFTKQLYEQMEVKEFLWYFTSFISVNKYDATIKQIKESYIKEGRDYEAEQKESYEESYNKIKPLLLKYLPEDLRGVVHNEFSIYGKIPKQNLMAKIEKYRKSIYDLDTNMSKKYSIYYKGIEKSLSNDIRNLNKEYSFHDSNGEHSLNEFRIVADKVSLSFLNVP